MGNKKLFLKEKREKGSRRFEREFFLHRAKIYENN